MRFPTSLFGLFDNDDPYVPGDRRHTGQLATWFRFHSLERFGTRGPKLYRGRRRHLGFKPRDKHGIVHGLR